MLQRARIARRCYSTSLLNSPLKTVDPAVFDIIEHEKQRQRESIVLIPSENFTSVSVMQALGSVMQNKYSEGYPGARYYGGNEFIDQAESLCQQRALETYRLDPAKWGVNVQSLSGAPANLYVYNALMKPHDRLMGLDLPHGGHLSHGYQTESKKISAVSTYFSTMGYKVDIKTGIIDYPQLAQVAQMFRPKILVGGASAYSRHWDLVEMRRIADSINAHFLFDMAHISGLVAAGVGGPDPFEYADIVTTTTHKSLRGPRGAMIFFRKGVKNVDKKGKSIMYDLENPINFSVFPGHQGGPHNHTITALAVALKQAQDPSFKAYQQQVIKNAKHMETIFRKLGYNMVANGTDTHLLMLDLRKQKIDGARVERVLELVNVAANKNTVPGDKSAMIPSGLRMGSPAMTSRGLVEADFEQVCLMIHRAVQLTINLNESIISADPTKTKVKDFKEVVGEDGGSSQATHISALKADVITFAKQFPVVGFDVEQMKYKE